jgi:hypothetical protein
LVDAYEEIFTKLLGGGIGSQQLHVLKGIGVPEAVLAKHL